MPVHSLILFFLFSQYLYLVLYESLVQIKDRIALQGIRWASRALSTVKVQHDTILVSKCFVILLSALIFGCIKRVSYWNLSLASCLGLPSFILEQSTIWTVFLYQLELSARAQAKVFKKAPSIIITIPWKHPVNLKEMSHWSLVRYIPKSIVFLEW